MVEQYEGYRLKIGEVVVKDNWIARGTYKCAPNQKRILKEWNDVQGKRHVTYAPHTRTEITFNIRKRDMNLQQQATELLKNRENVEITYWNERKMQYETCLCDIESEEYISSKKNGQIWYEETSVKITQN